MGYDHITIEDLVDLRDHGVTPLFASRVRQADGRLPSVRELIERRDRGDRD
jgi:hypothetical protein